MLLLSTIVYKLRSKAIILAREIYTISTKPGFELAKGRLKRLFQPGAIHIIVPVVKPNRLPVLNVSQLRVGLYRYSS